MAARQVRVWCGDRLRPGSRQPIELSRFDFDFGFFFVALWCRIVALDTHTHSHTRTHTHDHVKTL